MNELQSFNRIADDVEIAEGTRVFGFANLYGCTIGQNCKVGTFVEIQKNVRIGNNVKLSSHSFVCEGVDIEDDVFIGHGVMFINDIFPKAAQDGKLLTEEEWEMVPTKLRKGASIGSNATILCGVTIGENALVGAGSVVTKDVPANTVVAGNPAKFLRNV